MNYCYLLRKTFALCILLLTSYGVKAQYCTSGLYYYGCVYDDLVKSFVTTGATTNISNTNTGCASSDGYIFYSSYTLVATKGNTVNFTISSGGYGEYYIMWIDYNADNDFNDAGEQIYSGTISANSSASNSFTIPTTATATNTRLRIRCSYYGTPTPCSLENYGECEDYSVTLNPACTAPTITVQPPTSRNFCTGGSASLGVTATGAATYRWQVNTGSGFTNLSDNANYSGTTTPGLVISNAPASFSNYSYRCVATAACSTSTNSSATTLTLVQPADITAHTQTLTACVGSSTSMNVTASNPVGYQWQAGSATSGFVNISDDTVYGGTNSNVLTVTKAPTSIAGLNYRCIVNGACNNDTTANILLNLLLSPEILEGPRNVLAKIGGTNPMFTITIDDHGTPVNYIWQASYDDVSFFTVQPNSLYNVAGHALELVNISKAQGGMYFRCLIKAIGNTCGTFYDTSASAQLVIDDPLSVTNLNNDMEVTLYPNPVTVGELFIRTGGNINATAVRITDKLGRTVYNGEINFSTNTASIPVSKLAPGIYSLQLFDKDKNVVNNASFTKQ